MASPLLWRHASAARARAPARLLLLVSERVRGGQLLGCLSFKATPCSYAGFLLPVCVPLCSDSGIGGGRRGSASLRRSQHAAHGGLAIGRCPVLDNRHHLPALVALHRSLTCCMCDPPTSDPLHAVMYF